MAEILDFSNFSKDAAGAGAAALGRSAADKDGLQAASDDGRTYEHPVPKAGEQVQYSYPAKKGSVAIELQTRPDAHAIYTVTAPADDVRPAISDAQTSLARAVGLDDRDLAAMSQLKQALGETSYNSFITSFVQRRFFAKAVARTGVESYLAPDYTTTDAPEEGKDYTFTADTLMVPQVSLSSYDPVEVEFPEKHKITSADVTAYLTQLADRLATYEPDLTRDTAIDGDRVVINIRATRNGKIDDAFTRDHVPYQIGSGLLGDEIDKNLTGMKTGQNKTFTASLPVDVNGDGSPAFAVTELTVRLMEIDRKVPARIDDGWVMKNIPQAQTLLGFRSQIRTALEHEADASQHEDLIELTASENAKRLQWDIPQDYIDRMRDELIEQYALDLQARGIDIRTAMNQPGFDQVGFKQEMEQQAVESLRRAAALDALADHRGIKVSDAEATKIVSGASADQQGQDAEALKAIRETGQMDQLRRYARRMQANEWLVKTAKDSSGPHLQLV